jgi:hypothetical protein
MSAEQKELFCAACRKATSHVAVDHREVRRMTRWFFLSWAVTYFAIGFGLALLRDLFAPHFYERTSRGIHYLWVVVGVWIPLGAVLLLLRPLLGRKTWILGFPLKPRVKPSVWRCEVCGRVRWEDKKRKAGRQT